MTERIKQRIVRLARDTRALGALDYVMFLLNRARAWRGNRRFVRAHPGFAVPPRSLAFDAYGDTRYGRYLETGRDHAVFIAGIVREHCPDGPLRVLEWGCGPGRIIRHLPGLLGERASAISGVDFNGDTIAWCRRRIPGVTFQRNELQPPLMFTDRSFDFVYAISVFTHLDERAWSDWLAELCRVMTESGVLAFTTHGRNFLPKLLPDERERFSHGQPVYRAKTAMGKKAFVAYHPREFVVGNLPAGLSVVSHSESDGLPGLAQDLWILRKSADPAGSRARAAATVGDVTRDGRGRSRRTPTAP